MKTLAPAALAVVLWCGGTYDPERGTNFGSCLPLPDRTAEVQSPGDAPTGDASTGGNSK